MGAVADGIPLYCVVVSGYARLVLVCRAFVRRVEGSGEKKQTGPSDAAIAVSLTTFQSSFTGHSHFASHCFP